MEQAIIGWLGGDPELRHTTTDGAAVAQLRVALLGKPSEPTVWIDVQVWDELAERVAESLTKGSPVVGAGRWKTSEWTTDEGEKRHRQYVRAWHLGPDLAAATVEAVKPVRKTKPSASKPSEPAGTDLPADPADED